MDRDGVEVRARRWRHTEDIPIQSVELFGCTAFLEFRAGDRVVLVRLFVEGPGRQLSIERLGEKVVRDGQG